MSHISIFANHSFPTPSLFTLLTGTGRLMGSIDFNPGNQNFTTALIFNLIVNNWFSHKSKVVIVVLDFEQSKVIVVLDLRVEYTDSFIYFLLTHNNWSNKMKILITL